MKSHLVRCAAAAALSWSSTPALAVEGDAFKCAVADFHVASTLDQASEDDFVDKNREKSFEVIETESSFVVVSKSEHFKTHSMEYEIRTRGTLYVAVSATEDGMSLDTFVLSSSPGDDGGHAATVVVQSPFFVNSWFLACKPAE